MLALIFSSTLGRVGAGLGAAALLLIGAYLYGRWDGRAACHEAELRSQITAMERQIKNTQEVLEATQEREKAALEEMQQLGAAVTEYATELDKERATPDVVPDQKNGPVKGPSPYLRKSDVRRLCAIYPDACRP